MVDIKGASMAATKLMAAGALRGYKLPMVPQKVQSMVQNTGTYDLIFPIMHIDFPTRLEVFTAIQNAFNMHHNTNKHFGTGSVPGMTTVPQIGIMAMETMIDGQKVRARSPVNSVGYGV